MLPPFLFSPVGSAPSPLAVRSPGEVGRVSAVPCSQDELTVNFSAALCSVRNLPSEAWASWGMFVWQDGGEGQGGFCGHRLQALAALGSGPGLLGS